MRPLVLIVSSAARERSDFALSLAASHAAVGGAAHLHIDAPATVHLSDPAFVAAVADVQSSGVVVTLCPTGLADHAVTPSPLPDADRIGLVALMAELGDDARLLLV